MSRYLGRWKTKNIVVRSARNISKDETRLSKDTVENLLTL